MAGIYLHIPFCKQACHYCDFHFSTTLKRKGELVQALCKELLLRKDELNEPVETIYFGGGTPSLLTTAELKDIFEAIYKNYKVVSNPEVTLEANPDDLSTNLIIQLSKSPINRLSIGVQSFFEEDLKLMNRAHTASEALNCIQETKKHFDNISIDLIYGIPGMSTKRWQENLDLAISLKIPHISSYALTVEPKTALQKFIETGKVPPIDDALSKQHYQQMLTTFEKVGYINYEFSNFGKPNYFSQNNTAYWTGKLYLGIGPSAHSYNGVVRKWNISNNIKYIKSITENKLPQEQEILSKTDKYNEYIMTGLRTMWGVSVKKIQTNFDEKFSDYLLKQAHKNIEEGFLELKDNTLYITKKGKFLTDGIAASLFMIN